MKKCLVLLAPGYQEHFEAGSQLALLKNEIEIRDGMTSARLASQSYVGYRFQTGDVMLDLFEADWQNSTPMLSAQGWLQKLFAGFRLLLMWLKPRTFIKAQERPSWYRWFAGIAAIMLVWWIGLYGSALQAVGGFLKTFGPQVQAAAVTDAGSHLSTLGDSISGWPVLAVATFLLAAFGMSVNASVDVADLFRRYLNNTRDRNNLPTLPLLRNTVTPAIQTLADDSYEEVTIVGHSFGVLLTIDAIAEGISRTVRFVTLGGFLAFLAAQNAWATQRIKQCLASSSLASWQSYYSEDDSLAGPAPVPKGTANFTEREVDLQARFFERLTHKTHGMYFESEIVRRAILQTEVDLRANR